MSDSTEVLLARLDERLKVLSQNQINESQGRDRLETTLAGVNDNISKMAIRLQTVEDSLARSEPTIEEFITIKHKVVGAGIFGKWVWTGAGVIIGLVAAFRKEVFAWFAG